MLTRREKTFLLRSFDRFKACLECNNDIHRTIKSILGKRLGFHIRSYFHTWRQNAQNLEAVDSAKDFGLQRLELNKLKAKIKLLKEKLLEDGYT